MTTYYVNLSAATNGTGTQANPFNTFVDVNLSGSSALVSNDTVLVKTGSSGRGFFRPPASLTGVRISTYGTGDRPIMDGSVEVTESWVLDGSNGKYYIASQSANHGLFADNTQMIDVSTVDDLTTDLTQWYDSGNSRIYVGLNPNNYYMEITSEDYCVYGVSPTNFVVHNLHCKRADNSNIAMTGVVSGCRVLYNTSEYAGGWNAGGRDGIVINAASGVPAAGVVVKGNNSSNNQNVGFEMSELSGVVAEDNILNANGNGFELWLATTGGLFQRNLITNTKKIGTSNAHSAGIWATSTDTVSGGGGHNDNTFINNIIDSPEGNYGVKVEGGTGWAVEHNTVLNIGGDGSSAGHAGFVFSNISGNDIVTVTSMKNNIGTTTTGFAGRMIDEVTNQVTLTTDNNVFYTDGTLRIRSQGSNLSGANNAAIWSAWQAVPHDANSLFEDPLVNSDYTLQDGSPARDAAASGLQPIDYHKYPRYGDNIGAVEPLITPNVSVGVNL